MLVPDSVRLELTRGGGSSPSAPRRTGDLKCVGDIFSAHCSSFLVTAPVREPPVAA
jgi:hypothetical protein